MNTYQRLILEKSFHSKLYPTNTEIHQLARSLNLSEVRIKKWYEKERYKKKQAGLLHKGEECLIHIKSTKLLLRIQHTDYIHRKLIHYVMYAPKTDFCHHSILLCLQ